MHADSLGNALTLQQAASLAAVNDFVEGFIACDTRVLHLLDAAATDQGAIVQAYAAALHMFAETPEAPAQARPWLARAQAAVQAGAATAREALFVTAVAAWVEGDIAQALRLHEQLAREHPRDLVAVKLGQYHAFNRGDAPGMLRLARQVLPAAAEVPHLHGMLAFGYEQCHYLREAEAAARHALGLAPAEPWAQHALAHVMLTEGRLAEGLDFLRGAAGGWSGLNSFMRTHNWWHLALFALDLDRPDEVLRLYDQQVWGVAKDYSQDQANAVSLLARLELAGVDVGGRWQDLADHLVPRTADHVLPFLDLHYLYGLARAGRPEAGVLLAGLWQRAEAADDAVAREVTLPAASGLLAHAQGDAAGAVGPLATALPRLREIGGSHAQRDLFQQVYIDALLRGGHAVEAQHLLQQQARQQPQSLRLARQAAAVAEALGIGPAG